MIWKRACLSSLVFAVLIDLSTGYGQQPWQHIQMRTASQVAQHWTSPPPEYGPEPYYGLNGPVSLPQVERDLDTLHGLGFQAITVQAGYGMPFAYLSPEYFAFFQQFVEQVKKRNMRIWIVDDAGYPSGFAGGKFTADYPQLRMQAIEIAERIHVDGGSHIDKELPANTLSAAAVDANGMAISIPLRGDHLDWTAPSGSWTVLIANHEFRTSPTRSDTNPRRVKDTEQSLEDYLNPAATQEYLRLTHDQYKHYVGDEFGRTIMGFRGDEPDYSIAGLPWTPDFFKRFRLIKGYDVEPYAALFAQTPSRRDPGLTIRLTPEQLRIKADYYDVFSRLFAEGFFKPQGDWCAANHLEYQVHLNHEEREMDLTHSEGSFFRDMQSVEVPGIDAIWHQIWTDTISDYPRLASSVAHAYGRPRAFTESFAAYRPAPDVKMARYIVNEQFVRGINLVEMMYFPATSAGPRPLQSYMGEPGFPDLLTYVRRMSYLMSAGRPDASVALLIPSSSMWIGDGIADEQFVSTERLLSEHQIDFDIVSDDLLASGLKVLPGVFQTRSGNSYHTVILPASMVLTDAAYSRLKSFAQSGGRVLILGGTPSLLEGRNIRDARTITPADFSWATVVNAQLPPTPTPPMEPPAESPQPQQVPAAVLSAMSSAVDSPTVILDRSDTALHVMKRKWANATVYLLFNESDHTINHQILLPDRGNSVHLWNPQNAMIVPLQSVHTAHGMQIILNLQPYETHVLVVQ